MGEIRDKVARIAADMFKHIVAVESDDPVSLERAAGQLGVREYANYLATCPHTFRYERGDLIETWNKQDPVRFLLSRKTLRSDELRTLRDGVVRHLGPLIPFRDECATAVLEGLLGPAWKFNPAEVGYLWRLIQDIEFPIMPETHGIEHDVVANLASMGADPEEVVELATFISNMKRGMGDA